MSNIKICSNCQSENDPLAKFCFNCGNKLPAQSEVQKACKSCGFINEVAAKYCGSCGCSLSKKIKNTNSNQSTKRHQKTKKKAHKTESKSLNPIYMVLLIFVAVLIFLYIENRNSKIPEMPQQFQPPIEQKTNNVVLENKVVEVAAKFVCSCGSCGEEPLETCSCPTAQQERQFIREKLLSGQTVENVISAVNTKYGWLKPEYKSQYEEGKLALDLKSTLKRDILPIPDVSSKSGERLASFSDRLQIISFFSCACGQCGIDELKDCNCNHPRGAIEVKKFIDDKIEENLHTVDNVIELVQKKYGNRIR